MRTPKESGAIWYNFKQNVENGFKLSFSYRFKRVVGASGMMKYYIG